jgi:predicted dehydrogenase
MHDSNRIDRRAFLTTAAAGAFAAAAPAQTKKTTVGVIGCGSVSEKYFPHLKKCPYADIVSTCDIVFERAQKAAAEHEVPNAYPSLDKMLAGAPFDLLVDLTNMQVHEGVNRQAIEAGKHVWSEKPMANSYAAGKQLLARARDKGLRFWGAPTPVLSPQFEFMAKTIAAGKLGRIAAAHASYGHLGPNWAAFFYEQGGGSMPDLMVYDLTVLTGLLGPAREVIAATTIITPTRDIIRDRKVVKVEAEDNAMVTMYHDQGALSHAQSGFNYFDAYHHTYTGAEHQTIDLFGREGEMHLVGYCWAPLAVDMGSRESKMQRYAAEPHDYVWQNGASHMAECMAKGVDSLVTPEHALHVVEIMQAARESQRTGRRIHLESTFKWPVLT